VGRTRSEVATKSSGTLRLWKAVGIDIPNVATAPSQGGCFLGKALLKWVETKERVFLLKTDELHPPSNSRFYKGGSRGSYRAMPVRLGGVRHVL